MPEIAPIWVRTDHRMGRFADLVIAARYVDLAIIRLPELWDIVANDYVVTEIPIDIPVELGYFSFAASDRVEAHNDAAVRVACFIFGGTLDTLSMSNLVGIEVTPFIQTREFVQPGPKRRQAILEAERLLGIDGLIEIT